MIYEGECRGDSKRGALPAHANPRKMAVKCLHGKISKNRLDSTFCQNRQKGISDHPQLSFTLLSTGVDRDSWGEVGPWAQAGRHIFSVSLTA